MKICIDKRDGSIVPDFRPNPPPGSLVANAVRVYLAAGQEVTEEDFEEKVVSFEEYKKAVEDSKGDKKPEENTEEKKKDDDA